MLEVPAKFAMNHPSVLGLGSQDEVGERLIEYLCDRTGRDDLSDTVLLDFGCGTRFAQSILNRSIPIKSYIGVDTLKELVKYLQENVDDKRFSFQHFNSFNYVFNRGGEVLNRESTLYVHQKVDLISMFSVITHQTPEDARNIFTMLRRYVKDGGLMFFTAKVEPIEYYDEERPHEPTYLSVYSLELLAKLLRISGWDVVSIMPASDCGLPMQNSVVCRPII